MKPPPTYCATCGHKTPPDARRCPFCASRDLYALSITTTTDPAVARAWEGFVLALARQATPPGAGTAAQVNK